MKAAVVKLRGGRLCAGDCECECEQEEEEAEGPIGREAAES